MKKLLVTTALESTWVLEKKFRRIFLTKACLIYNERNKWQDLDKKVLNYHWDNREKMHKDFKYLFQVYEQALLKITDELNLYHETDDSVDYWRIILGPWLIIYVHSLFDKWEILRNAFDNGKKYFTVLETENTNTSKDYNAFMDLIDSDSWNYSIYCRIIRSIYSLNVDMIKISTHPLIVKKNNFSITNSVKIFFKIALELIMKFLSSKNKKVFIHLNKLPLSRLIKLNISLFQIPQFYHKEFYFSPKKTNPDKHFRERKIKVKKKNDFEFFLYNNILRDIPISYLESFRQIKKFTSTKKLNPLLIFTDIGHFDNDVFKVWLANQKKNKKKIYTVYHGGSIPILFNTIEKHEEVISEKNITFFKPLNKKQFQLPPYFIKGGVRENFKGKYCSLIGFEHNRHTFKAASMPISNKTMDIFNLSIKFCKSLNKEVFDSLRIRPYPEDLGWNTSERYRDILKDSKIDTNKHLNSCFKSSKLIICTYPQTTFSEAMASGKPTILVYEPKYNENHNEAKELLHKLKCAKIIFNDPIKAAIHVNLHWDKIDEWWSSNEVVLARNYFYNSALRINYDWNKEWKLFINNEINYTN